MNTFIALVAVATVFLSAVKAQKCGVPAVKPDTSTKLVGGKEAIPYSWPWQVSIQGLFSDNGFQHWCGGSLISNQWILTSAKCFAPFLPYWPKLQARLGVFDSDLTEEPGEQVINITEYHVHPDYNRPNRSENSYNDVALMKLNEPVKYTDHISPICLPTKQDEDLPAAGTVLFIAGHGWKNVKNPGTGKSTLRQISGPINAIATCQQQYRDYGQVDAKTQFCAGGSSVGPWMGDEGGPGVVQDPPGSGTWKQVGISNAWTHDRPWIFHKVSAYLDFIKKYVIID